MNTSSATIPKYIACFPKEVQKKLQQFRKAIHEAAPRATEAISYGIPTFKLNGNLVHFGGFKKHVSFFPGSEAIVVFKKDLAKYTVSKGTIQFPLDAPLPITLIKKITRFRVQQNAQK